MKLMILLAALLMPLYAQRDVYKVDFAIRDSADTAAKTGRKYSLMVYAGNKGNFKVGNRVPIPMSPAGAGYTSYTYLDVGVNLDCTVSEANGRIALRSDMD